MWRFVVLIAPPLMAAQWASLEDCVGLLIVGHITMPKFQRRAHDDARLHCTA
jgi:hypothetical protein